MSDGVVVGLLALLGWTFSAGAFWMSVRVLRREVRQQRTDINGMGAKMDKFHQLWREMLAVSLENATDPEQRARLVNLLRVESVGG